MPSPMFMTALVCFLQYDATLPEFNHVMLNHLYALSIKVTHGVVNLLQMSEFFVFIS